MAKTRGDAPPVPETPPMFKKDGQTVPITDQSREFPDGTVITPAPGWTTVSGGKPVVLPETEDDDTDTNTCGRKKRLVSGEIAAMADIEKVLESLDADEQRRVMTWMCDKYEFYVTAIPKLEPK